MSDPGLLLIQPTWPLGHCVEVLSTTRNGGFSAAPYNDLNLALHVGDDASSVERNRSLLKQQLQLPQEPKWLQQVHATTVVCADGLAPDKTQADASYSQQVGTVCAILSADCMPVVLAASDGSCVALAHAGWRGLAAGILQSTLAIIRSKQSTDVEFYAWLGPAIGPQVFEVGAEVRVEFIKQELSLADAFQVHSEQSYLCDLYLLARHILAAAGVNQVFGGEHCTYTEKDQFFSYRREATTGRIATLAYLK